MRLPSPFNRKSVPRVRVSRNAWTRAGTPQTKNSASKPGSPISMPPASPRAGRSTIPPRPTSGSSTTTLVCQYSRMGVPSLGSESPNVTRGRVRASIRTRNVPDRATTASVQIRLSSSADSRPVAAAAASHARLRSCSTRLRSQRAPPPATAARARKVNSSTRPQMRRTTGSSRISSRWASRSRTVATSHLSEFTPKAISSRGRRSRGECGGSR